MNVREIIVKYGKTIKVEEPVSSPGGVWEFFRQVGITDDVKENFYVLILNNKNVPLSYERISTGTISESIIHPREVFAEAVKERGSLIIVVHNHPSGVLTPSKDDIETTKRLVASGKILGVPLVDHVIVSNDGHYSMRDNNDMEE